MMVMQHPVPPQVRPAPHCALVVQTFSGAHEPGQSLPVQKMGAHGAAAQRVAQLFMQLVMPAGSIGGVTLDVHWMLQMPELHTDWR